jgi:CRISPR/Cas system-associated exonuclease Cas4 (RecB family)
MLPVEHLSYSSLSAYNACARAWKYHYIDKVPVLTSANLVFGSTFHRVVEAYLSTRATGGELDLLGYWRHSWEEAQKEKIIWGKDTPDSMNETGLRMLETFEIINALDGIKLAMNRDNNYRVEERISLTAPGVPVPITGYIDFVAADGVPCDIKTAARSWEEGKADQELQPTFYLAAMNQAGENVDRFRYYIFTKAKAPKVQVIETRRTVNDMFWLIQALSETCAAIEAGAFPPTGVGSWKCTPEYCEYWEFCKK